ncbi:DUF6380 family protein [Streptomyces sp. enrichment culture]
MGTPVQEEAGEGRRRATHRWRVASWTETVGRAPSERRDRRTGETAR